MKKTVVTIIGLLLCTSVSFGSDSLDQCADQIEAVKEAVSRFICYQSYWAEWGYIPGQRSPMEIKCEGEKFFVRINDIRSSTLAPLDTNYLRGRVKNGKGVVAQRIAYNGQKGPAKPLYLEQKGHFENGPVIKDIFIVPKDCTPVFDPTTSEKEKMLETVARSVKDHLSDNIRRGYEKHPKNLTLVIGDFNTDYWSTYVFVRETKRIYHIELHDRDDWDSSYGEHGFLTKEVRLMDSLVAKTQKHGIIRKITLDP